MRQKRKNEISQHFKINLFQPLQKNTNQKESLLPPP